MSQTGIRKRILCLIPVWQRPEITRICYAGLNRIDAQFLQLGFSFVPFIVYSEPEHGELARRSGFLSCFAENKPLGAKLNRGLSSPRKARAAATRRSRAGRA